MRFNVPTAKKRDLSEHIQDLTDIVGLMVDGLDSKEKAALDKALINMYKLAGAKGGKKKNKQPLLKDLYYELQVMGYKKLCERLERITIFACWTLKRVRQITRY